MKINDIITSGVQGVDWDEDDIWMKTAAQIQVPATSGGYTTYYYLNDGYVDDGTEEGAEAKGWCDMGGSIVDDEFTPGVAAWFKSVPADGSATISGAVSKDAYQTVGCPVGFALRANTFPVTVTLNTTAMTSEDIVGVDWDEDDVWMKTAPQIQVPSTSGGYTTYYYLNDGYVDDGTEEGAEASGWCDMGGSIVSDTIPAGQGFWTKGVTGAFTIKFTK